MNIKHPVISKFIAFLCGILFLVNIGNSQLVRQSVTVDGTSGKLVGTSTNFFVNNLSLMETVLNPQYLYTTNIPSFGGLLSPSITLNGSNITSWSQIGGGISSVTGPGMTTLGAAVTFSTNGWAFSSPEIDPYFTSWTNSTNPQLNGIGLTGIITGIYNNVYGSNSVLIISPSDMHIWTPQLHVDGNFSAYGGTIGSLGIASVQGLGVNNYLVQLNSPGMQFMPGAMLVDSNQVTVIDVNARTLNSTNGRVANWSTGSLVDSNGNAYVSNLLVQNLPYVFNVTVYGAKGDGTTDDTAAITNAINAAVAAGGGIVEFPASTNSYVVLGQITVPTYGQDPYKSQKSITLRGYGAGWMCAEGNSVSTLKGASIVDLRYSGQDGKILVNGFGHFSMEGLQLIDTTDGTAPFVYITSTTAKIHDCAFIGKTLTNTTQDAIILGGLTQSEGLGSYTNAFQGYGTVLRENYFGNIQRAIYLRTYANNINFIYNTVWNTCGGYAAIQLRGGSSFNGRNSFVGNTIESTHYQHTVVCENAKYNMFWGNGFWDAANGSVNLDYIVLSNSVYNTFSGDTISPLANQVTGDGSVISNNFINWHNKGETYDPTGNGQANNTTFGGWTIADSRDSTRNYPGGLTIAASGNLNKFLSMVYDETNDQGFVSCGQVGVGDKHLYFNCGEVQFKAAVTAFGPIYIGNNIYGEASGLYDVQFGGIAQWPQIPTNVVMTLTGGLSGSVTQPSAANPTNYSTLYITLDTSSLSNSIVIAQAAANAAITSNNNTVASLAGYAPTNNYMLANASSISNSGGTTNGQIVTAIDFTNTASVASVSNGRIYINTTYGITSAYFADSNGFIERINRDGFQTVKNGESTTLNPGELVYFTGITNTVHIVKRACANSAATMPCQGVIADTIASGAFGHMQFAGRTDFAGLDTTLYTTNATVYVSAVTPGGWTSALPSTVAGTNLNQIIGFVNRIGTTNGEFSLRMSPTQSIMRQATGTITAGLIYQTSAGGQPALLPNITLAQMPTLGITTNFGGMQIANGCITNVTATFEVGWEASAASYFTNTAVYAVCIDPEIPNWYPSAFQILPVSTSNVIQVVVTPKKSALWGGGSLNLSWMSASLYTNQGNFVTRVRYTQMPTGNIAQAWSSWITQTNMVNNTTTNAMMYSIPLGIPAGFTAGMPWIFQFNFDTQDAGTTLIGTNWVVMFGLKETGSP